MSYTKRTLEELDLMDDFLMNAVASDPDVREGFCRRLLSVLLQKEIGKVKVKVQKAIVPERPDLRGIRMDVKVEEVVQERVTKPTEEQGIAEQSGDSEEWKERITDIYDIEPHRRDDCNLPRRSRFYQAKIDSKNMRSGEVDFARIPNLYVITFTDYDPFDMDYMMYVFRNRCDQVPGLTYDDGLQFIYFYTKGTKGGCKDIKNMLEYMRNSNKTNAVDEATREIHDYVRQVKVDPEVKVGYMRFDEIINYERQDAKEEGIQEGMLESKREDILELLESYGVVPEEIRSRIVEERDIAVLKKWFQLATKIDSIEKFVKEMDA